MQAADPRKIPAREIAFVCLGAALLALVVHWPLPLHLADAFPRDLGDPIVQAWQVAWGGHALIHQPLHFFDANQYWPLKDTLAFSDALIGYAPTGLIGRGVEATTIRYNLLFLFAYALAFAGAYFLARELRLRPAAAAVAGAAFAYAPWRLEQDGHLHVISSGGIPLTIFLLLRGYRQESVKLIVAGWLVAAWQFSLGFTLGLQLGYLLAFLAALSLIALWRGGREKLPPRRVLVATAAGGSFFLVSAVVLALPYLRVLGDHPEAARSLARVANGSGPLWEFLSAPENNAIWGGVTESIRHQHLSSIAEQTLFPGLTIFALATAGLCVSVFSKKLRLWLGLGALALILLSLGVRETGLGQYLPYRALYEFAPGWQGVRTPGRLNTLTSLILALLAAAGTQALIEFFKRKAPSVRPGRVAFASAGAIVALVCFEFVGDVLPKAPREPASNQAIAQPQLHLPITIAANRRYVYWSTDGFPKIVNGRASIDPQEFTNLTAVVSGFPDQRSVRALKHLGVRSVVLHPYLLVGTRWWQSASKPIDGLGISRRVQGDLVIYDLPASAGESGALAQ
jgi:hypothetical protein